VETSLAPPTIRAAALDALDDATCILDPQGDIVYVNTAFLRATGRTLASTIGLPARELLSPDGEVSRTSIGQVLAAERAWHGELWLHRVDGTRFLGRCNASVMESGHVVGVFRDITWYRRSAEAARRSATSFRALIEGYPDGVAVHRGERFVYVNHSFVASLGYGSPADLVGRPLIDVIHPSDRDAVLALLKTLDQKAGNERRLVRRDGTVVQTELVSLPAMFDGEPAYVLIARDLSTRRAMETRMREMDRMVSVGTLAAGIAHEINTPIQFVGDSAHFLQGAFTDLLGLIGKYRALRDEVAEAGWLPEQVLELVAEEEVIDTPYLEENCPKAIARTLEGVSRVATIVRALKEFGHPGKTEMAPADLNQAILNTITVARNEWKYVAEVETHLGSIPLVMCHVGSLSQVFLNLLVNAAHAIGDVTTAESEKGRIRISTVQEGNMVHIAVQDTGSGIPEAVRGRIFDPFFTTKDVGKGTGQGLAISRSIVVDKHGGSIHFDTASGVGTTFHIVVPVGPA
jgi:PAS domain S-box-containing protein